VVGGERAAQVQAEQALLDDEERQRLQRRQHPHQRGDIAGDVSHQQQPLDGVGPARAPQDGLDAGQVQVGRFQQQQGEEQPGLVAGDEADQPVFGVGLVGGESERGDADVGVQVFVVGVGVVAVVLGHPPVEAHPAEQVGVQQADPVVGPPGPEDLPVPGVVADEGDLGEDDRQEGSRGQLPPRLPDDGEGDPPGGQQGQVETDPGPIPAPPAVQQAGLLDLPRQLGVLAPPALRRHRKSSRFEARAGHVGSVLLSSGSPCTVPPPEPSCQSRAG
jgi:hypothetical protein